MTSHKMLFTLSVLIALNIATAQYDTYESSDEDDESSSEKPREDYSKYFGGHGTVAGPGVVGDPSQAPDSPAGFVQPLDFTGIFNAGHFGLDGQLGGETRNVFKTPSGTLPLTAGVFSDDNVQVTSNTSGFVNNVKFPSLFDTSSSSSENGFRPQDFLQRGSHPESTSPRNFYSPAFSTLQRDVDREVDYQRKEEDTIGRSRAVNRQDPEYDSEDDEEGGEFDSFEFDDSPPTEHRSSHNKYNKPLLNVREEKQISPNGKELSYKTPYSTVNQVNFQGQSRPLAANPSPKKVLASSLDENDEHTSSFNHRSRQQKGRAKSLNRPTPYDGHNNSQYPKVTRQPTPKYNYPSHTSPQSYPSKYKDAYSRPITNGPPNYSVHPKRLSHSPRAPGHSLSSSPSYFRPSPTDPYLDNTKTVDSGRVLGNSGPRYYERDGIHSLPQTEYATVVKGTSVSAPKPPPSNKRVCKKINKQINPDDFARFKRQQMTCYICKNKEKGNTYEECSYESDPKSNSFYKGSAEAYSSNTALSPTKHHVQKRSYTPRHYSHGIQGISGRNGRQDYYDYDGDEQGHGQEHYRFGQEYFNNPKDARNVMSKSTKPSKRTDQEEDDYYDDEYDEETDVEKEYSPPGASENDDCHKVNRNGLICMVCQKENGGGTYEQCSYASNPEANKYEYAKSSSYGSKRPSNDRYKRYSVHENDKLQKYDIKNSNKRHHARNKKNADKRRDYNNGKLKRKKVRQGEHKKPLRQSVLEENTSHNEEFPKVVGLDPFFYGSSEHYNPDDYDERGIKIKRRDDSDDEGTAASSTEDEREDSVPTYEDSFYRLFPELVGTDPYTGEILERKVKEKEAKEKRDDIDHPQIPYEEVEDEEESESILTHRKIKPKFDYGLELPDYYFSDDAPKKDLEKTLNEFTHKNRSDCKKVMKDKMTCYQCVNKNGLQHEECMFVAASEPKSKHLAYHEVKEFHVVPTESTNKSISDNVETHRNHNENNTNKIAKNDNLDLTVKNGDVGLPIVHKFPKRNQKRRKQEDLTHAGTLVGNERNLDAESTESEILTPMSQDILKIRPKELYIPYYDTGTNVGSQREKRNPKNEHRPVKKRKNRKRENSKIDENEDNHNPPQQPVQSNYNSIPPDPEDFDKREGPEGAYSHETEPVYDSILKITLPRYMLTRSEHEDVFDEVLRSG